jgi:hypothetical protein
MRKDMKEDIEIRKLRHDFKGFSNTFFEGVDLLFSELESEDYPDSVYQLYCNKISELEGLLKSFDEKRLTLIAKDSVL